MSGGPRAGAPALLLLLCVGCAGPAGPIRQASDGFESDLDRAYAELDRTPYDDTYGWHQRGSILFGERNFDQSLGLGRGDQAVAGIELIGGPPGAWVDVEVGLSGSARGRNVSQWLDRVFGDPDFEDLTGDDSGLGNSSLEFSVGVQKRLLLFDGFVRPYIGGGAAAIRRRSFRVEADGVDDDFDSDLGWYTHAGIHFLWGDGIGIGIDFRRLGGTDLELEGLGTSADYDQWSLTFGFGV